MVEMGFEPTSSSETPELRLKLFGHLYIDNPSFK